MARINWANPLTRGLVFCVTTEAGIPTEIIRKLHTQTVLSVVGTQIGPAFGPSGSTLNTGFQATAITSEWNQLNLTNSFTVVSIWVPTQITGSGSIRVAGIYYGSGYSWYINLEGGTPLSFQYRAGWSGTNSNITVAGLSVNTPSVLVGTFIPKTNGTSIWSGYLNGTLFGRNGNAPLDPTGTSNTSQIQVARLIGDGVKGLSPLTLIYNRTLSDSEIIEISRNPWQVIAPALTAMDYDTPIVSNINNLAPEQTFPEPDPIIELPHAKVNFAYLEVPERLRKSKTGFSIF
jgi:hypothetical protein